MSAQRALSSQSCSTSAPTSAFSRAHHMIRCNASSSDTPRQDSRHKQLFSKGYSTGCYVQRPPPQIVSSRNGVGPAVMQGLGTPLPAQQSYLVQNSQSDSYDVTEFVAETLLPTRTGKYRLRGYRHTVGPLGNSKPQKWVKAKILKHIFKCIQSQPQFSQECVGLASEQESWRSQPVILLTHFVPGGGCCIFSRSA